LETKNQDFLSDILKICLKFECIKLLFNTTDFEEPARQAPFGVENEHMKMMTNEERIAVS
jgi:hypothetical protein